MHTHKAFIMKHTPQASEQNTCTSVQKQLKNLEEHNLSSAKVRYVGGSVIGRLVYREGKKMDMKIGHGSDKAKSSITTYSILKHIAGHMLTVKDTQYPNTLSEITDRMFGALTFLTDPTYLFFLLLEKKRLMNLNEAAVAAGGGRVAGDIIKQLHTDTEVQEAWIEAIKGEQKSHHSIISAF